MKKIVLIAIMAILGLVPAMAKDRISYNVKELPQAAQQTLSKYFPGAKVNHIKIDSSTFGGTDYDVVLSNGCEIDFDSKGNWTEVDCGTIGVPAAMVLPAINNYVAKNFKGRKISTVEIKRNKYEVELSDGTDLEFDRAGNFKRIDR